MNARKIKEWAEKHGRLPKRSEEDEEEKDLAIKLGSIRTWLNNDKEAEGKGIVSQVFDVLRDHLFQKDISAIYASCDKTNTRSIDFLKSKGLQEVATYNSTYQRHFVDLMQTKRDYLFYKRLEQNQKGRE